MTSACVLTVKLGARDGFYDQIFVAQLEKAKQNYLSQTVFIGDELNPFKHLHPTDFNSHFRESLLVWKSSEVLPFSEVNLRPVNLGLPIQDIVWDWRSPENLPVEGRSRRFIWTRCGRNNTK